MDTRSSDEYYHLVYDPLLHGYTDSYFKTSSGTPAISTNVLRLNAASCYTTGQYMFGEYKFKVNVPTPTDATLTMGAAGTVAITSWDQITNGEFAVTLDGTPYNVTGINFSGGVYTPAYLTGGNAATSAIDTWAAVSSGGFDITINGTLRHITGLNFKSAFPYTSAYLTGGNAATSTIATWAAVTDGSFSITIDGTPRTVSAIDFSNVAAYTPAFLTGGTDATAVPATWAAVADGEFVITINGVSRSVTGIDFTGVTTMAEVATKIQTAIRALTTGLETVVWSTDHFVVSSVNTTSTSAITVTSAVPAGSGTDISGAGATDFMDADTGAGNGVVTNKVSLMTMSQVATTIQTAIRTLTSGLETVTWNTNHFVISSVNTTVDSAITVLGATGGGTDISGVGATTFMDAEIAIGTVTAHTTTKAMADVAALIQSAVRTSTGALETVVWSANHFVISSVNTTSISAITVTSAPAGGTDISGVGATTFLDAENAVGSVTARAMADSMDYVASLIQAAVVALTGQADTVTFDTDHFVLTSNTTLGVSSVTVLSVVAGGTGTDISGAGYLNGLAGTGAVTNASTKTFGLKLPAMGATNNILFQVIGNKLICRIYDKDGNTEYKTVTWLAAWSGASVEYGLEWYADRVRFTVGGNEVANLAEYVLRDVPLSVYLSNTDANNMDVGYLYFKGVRKTNHDFTLENINVDLNPGTITIGTVEVAPPTAVAGGSKTVTTAGTAVALSATTPAKSLYIRAKTTNTGNIYLGDSSVDKTTSKQIILAASDVASVDIDDPAKMYIDADTNGEGVDFLILS